MRQGHTTAIPVADEVNIDEAEVTFTVTLTLKVRDLRDLHKGLDQVASGIEYVEELYPVTLVAAEAYEAAKTQLGAVHVNGHDAFVEADLILPIIRGVAKARAEGHLDEVEALAIAGEPDELAKFLGVQLPAA